MGLHEFIKFVDKPLKVSFHTLKNVCYLIQIISDCHYNAGVCYYLVLEPLLFSGSMLPPLLNPVNGFCIQVAYSTDHTRCLW